MTSFSKKLWNIGRKIEDDIKPYLDEFLDCDFQRSDNVYDILDFHDDNRMKIVEVKGRQIRSDEWEKTIITVGKLTEGLMEIEKGYDVYYFFVFTDKTLYFKLDPEDCNFNMKYTGSMNIPHYLIPISGLIDFDT